jgi:hypothetical protein
MTVGGTREKLSMIATVTNQGKTRWMIIDDAFDAEKLIKFLAALIKDAGKKVFLILDNLRVHHSKIVKAWAAERKDQIELFYLPSYDQRKSLWDSPQLNPEERLNADLKQEMGRPSTCSHQSQITRRNQRPYDDVGAKPGARHELLPRPAHQVCRLRLHRAGAIMARLAPTSGK